MVVPWCWALTWLLQICFKKTLNCAVWFGKIFVVLSMHSKIVLQLAGCLPKASSKSAVMRTCMGMRSLLCLSRVPLDWLASNYCAGFYGFFFFTFFILCACAWAQLRQGWTIFICKPHDFLTNGLSQWFRPLVSLYLVQRSVLHVNLFLCIYSDKSLSLSWHHQLLMYRHLIYTLLVQQPWRRMVLLKCL